VQGADVRHNVHPEDENPEPEHPRSRLSGR
jgi:hypothetical protein